MDRTLLRRMRWGALPVLALLILSLAPQFHLWFVRGTQWNGAYAGVQGDEFLYSGYINALMNGRPRRNDPFAGLDSTLNAPLPESTFSIQVVPSILISSLGRIFGISASASFIVLIGISALLAALMVFWFLVLVTGNSQTSAVGSLFVFCFGALAAGEGLIGLLLTTDTMFLGLPFLRRYQPAATFPLFFFFCICIWYALNADNKKTTRIFSMVGGLVFCILVFSYLYLWTAAIAWFVLLAGVWFISRYRSIKDRKLELFAIVVALALVALVPYFYLVSNRAENLDEAQTLLLTHRPDLLRIPEIVGGLVIIFIIFAVRRQRTALADVRILFAASFASLPFAVFNQQVLTGKSMQPYHFETFIANYSALLSVVIIATVLSKPFTRRSLVSFIMLCCLWGAVEVTLAVIAHSRSSVRSDQMIPVLRRLNELSKEDGTLEALRSSGKTATVVFSPQRDVMGMLPTWTSQGTLLNMGGLDFGSATHSQRKQFLYLYLYYCGTNPEGLRELLSARTEDFFMGHYARIAIFGHERVVPMLSSNFQPIREDEIEEQVRLYQTYLDTFSRENILLRPLTYVVTGSQTEPDLSHIDRWYERDVGERDGDYILYRVKLRD